MGLRLILLRPTIFASTLASAVAETGVVEHFSNEHGNMEQTLQAIKVTGDRPMDDPRRSIEATVSRHSRATAGMGAQHSRWTVGRSSANGRGISQDFGELT